MSASAPIRRCPNGHDAATCADLIAALFPRGKGGTKRNRLCPCHDDTEASLSFNPGTKGMWLVWCCGAGCSHEGIRAEALDRGADPGCLGNYGLPKRAIQPGMRITGYDPVLVASAKRWHAIQKLPADLNGSLLQMCIQAIGEGDGDLPGDPFRLLPVNSDDFYALAKRAGLGRYRYQLFAKWLRYEGA